MNITFTNTFNYEFGKNVPQPSSKFLPEWYKNTESYINGQKTPNGVGQTSATVKRCMPVFDAITAGYIIPTYTDVYVSQKNGLPWYEWPTLEPIQFHPIEQAQNHPNSNGAPYPKWINPWSIKTPSGYSTLFVQPFHQENKYFTILPGIVDTDTYTAPVNFPFVLNNVKFEGIIPAGTPMAQVIMIKRDKWEMSFGSDEDNKEQSKVFEYLRTTFFDSYKSKYRTPKEYL